MDKINIYFERLKKRLIPSETTERDKSFYRMGFYDGEACAIKEMLEEQKKKAEELDIEEG
jgi:hypothetical protein